MSAEKFLHHWKLKLAEIKEDYKQRLALPDSNTNKSDLLRHTTKLMQRVEQIIKGYEDKIEKEKSAKKAAFRAAAIEKAQQKKLAIRKSEAFADFTSTPRPRLNLLYKVQFSQILAREIE
jgi:hypothetical protein